MKTKETTSLIPLTLIAFAVVAMSLVDSSTSDAMMYDDPILEFGLPKTELLRRDTTDGRQVATSSRNTIDLSKLPNGVYAVQVLTERTENKGSTLIRL